MPERLWLMSEPICVEPRRITSVPPFAVVNSLSKFALSVSPSSSVPARKATPSTTAIMLPARRRLCDHISENATVTITPPAA